MDFLLVARLFHLDDGTGFDEQAGDFDGFAERAAAVIAKVDDQQVHAPFGRNRSSTFCSPWPCS